MNILNHPSLQTWPELCRRNVTAADDAELTVRVAGIISAVRSDGDRALRDFARDFDGVTLDSIILPEDERQALIASVPEKLKQAIRAAARNIETFHRAQIMQPIEVETVPGVRCMQRQVPIDTVGLYVPGGRAPLFSTVLMLGIPACIAGCREVVLCTPRGRDGIAAATVFAADVCGITRIYQTGGAQAVAAMAYGTGTVPQVHKIFGPGNRYVTRAKQMVTDVVAIDMPAGPSEVMVIADSTADPRFVAADLLSQAEHGPDSQAILVTDSAAMAEAVASEVERQKTLLPRAECVEGSLRESRLIVLGSIAECFDFANMYAPEHLIVAVENPCSWIPSIKAAGSVFLGNYACESAGDYASGTNHTLPTSAWARSYSGVNLDSYMRKITYQEINPDGLRAIGPTIVAMARAEGLDAHANAVTVRLEDQ